MTYGPLAGLMGDFIYASRNRLIQAGDTVYAYDAENQRIGVNSTSFVVNPSTSSGHRSQPGTRRITSVALSDAAGAVAECFQRGRLGNMKNANSYFPSILTMRLFGNVIHKISLFILCCILLGNISCTESWQEKGNITLTDLMWSCLNLDYDSVAMNIDFQNINRQNEYGNTALMYAVGVNSHEQIYKSNHIRNKIVNLLIDSKSDIDITNSDGVTALIISVSHGDYDIAHILIIHNANTNIRDKYGFTALMYSAHHCNPRIANLLIDISDKEITNDSGKTAKDIALDEECYSVSSIL